MNSIQVRLIARLIVRRPKTHTNKSALLCSRCNPTTHPVTPGTVEADQECSHSSKNRRHHNRSGALGSFELLLLSDVQAGCEADSGCPRVLEVECNPVALPPPEVAPLSIRYINRKALADVEANWASGLHKTHHAHRSS
jgi:hypothetical protein